MLGTPKLLIKYYFQTNFPAHIVCRKARIKVWTLEVELARAKRSLQKALDFQSETEYASAKLDPPSASASTASDRGLVRTRETEAA
jgi:hypothetical protein